MSRRKHSSDLICCVCGQEIREDHEFYVKKRGEIGYHIMHGDCIDEYTKARKRATKKSK